MAATLAFVVTTQARSEPPATQPDSGYVSRAEYESLKGELAEMRRQLEELRNPRSAGEAKATATAPSVNPQEVADLRQQIVDLRKTREEAREESQAIQDEIDRVVKDVQKEARLESAGTTKLLITGDAFAGFTAQRGSPSTFQAGVAPRFLWEINDRLYFDAAFDVNLGRDANNNNQTTFDLTNAVLNYTVNDNLVVGIGQFIVPFAAYHRDFDPSWITKLPDDPLVFSDGGLAPDHALGAVASGAYRINDMKVNYALYIDNGPDLNGGDGTIDFDNFQDVNNNKAVGGRIGFLPIPQLEVGYSVQYGRASANSFTPPGNTPAIAAPDISALVQAIDFNYTDTSRELGGVVTLRSEWVWSQTQDATVPITGLKLFDNNRDGGYVQLSYRPSLSGYKLLRDFEFIGRYDRMDLTGKLAPLSGQPVHEARYTLGIDYWLNAQTVVKLAYEIDDRAHQENENAYLLQLGVGF